MGRPATIVLEITARLEPWLEACMAAYLAQTEPREPTLPATSDGKVNVRAVTVALGLKLSQEQHFYRHPELALLLNTAAEAQGLAPVGSRTQQNTDDAAVHQRISRAKAEASDYARALAEREGVIERQRRRITQLEEMLRIRDETGLVVRTEPVR